MTWWAALAVVAIFMVPSAVLVVVRRDAMKRRGGDLEGRDRWQSVLRQTWGQQGPPGSDRDRSWRDQTWWTDRR